MRAHWLCTSLSAACFFATTARAELIRYTFHGSIMQVSGPLAPPPGVVVGAPWSFAYTFDTNAPDLAPGPSVGEYASADVLAAIAGFQIAAPTGLIDVGDTFAGDSYAARMNHPLGQANVLLQDPTGVAFSSDQLADPLSLVPFISRRFTILIEHGPAFWSAEGAVDRVDREVVPGPATPLVLLVFGLRHRRARVTPVGT